MSALDTARDSATVLSALDTAHDTAITNDLDGDGFTAIAAGGDDCDDSDASVHPGATETCNLVDDNCDDIADEGCPTQLNAGTEREGLSWTCSTAGSPSGGLLLLVIAVLVLWKRDSNPRARTRTS